MKAITIFAMLAVLANVGAARSVNQSEEASAPAAKPSQTNGQQRGIIFDFRKNKNALQELQRIDNEFGAGLLERTLRNADIKGGRSRLARELERDDDLGIDLDNEALIFRCKGLVPNAGEAARFAAATASSLSPGDADPAASAAWTLTSRPNASKKLWLDFRGGVVTRSAWNTGRNSRGITIPPYDKDNNPSNFNTVELSDIVAIWRAVSEDFAPFDVDVTTIPQTNTNPTLYMRVMIGGDGRWFARGVGGVAYVNVFGLSTTFYQPAFVFPKALSDYPKNIWEAVSHEIGHTMGLSHDGSASTAYWQGNDANYAAIMGAGYYKQLTVWDRGEYAGANNREDDVAIIASKLGYIKDENGNSIATATPLAVSVSGMTATGTASGVVAKQEVANFFSFDAGAGPAYVTLTTVIPWSNVIRSNLDARVQVFDPNGNLVADLNPSGVSSTNGLGLLNSLVAITSAGTHYVAVSGAGAGVANTNTGYSSYGIRGQFALSVTFPAPDAAVTTG